MVVVGTVLNGVLAATFCVPLALIVSADLRERRIPNVWVLILGLGGLLQMAALPTFFDWLPPGPERLGCASLVLLGGFGLELLWRSLHHGSHGVGLGDIKLVAALALWLGWGAIPMVGLACVGALALELPRRHAVFAFGPYIAAASVVCLVVGAL